MTGVSWWIYLLDTMSIVGTTYPVARSRKEGIGDSHPVLQGGSPSHLRHIYHPMENSPEEIFDVLYEEMTQLLATAQSLIDQDEKDEEDPCQGVQEVH